MKKYKNRVVVELTTTQPMTCKEAGRILGWRIEGLRMFEKVTINEFNRVMASEMLKHPVFQSMTKGVPTKAKRS